MQIVKAPIISIQIMVATMRWVTATAAGTFNMGFRAPMKISNSVRPVAPSKKLRTNLGV